MECTQQVHRSGIQETISNSDGRSVSSLCCDQVSIP